MRTFRQLILDRLALLIPEWRERNVPDVGIALVELMAYVGDHLSYYQDAVATEAYLDTARHRISVRRHARLVDYVLHEGCNARAFLVVETESDEELDPQEVFFVTSYPGAPEASRALVEADLPTDVERAFEVFEPLVADPSQSIPTPSKPQRDRLLHLGEPGMLPAGRRHERDTPRLLVGDTGVVSRVRPSERPTPTRGRARSTFTPGTC